MAITMVLISVSLGFGVTTFASELSHDLLGRRLHVLPAVMVGFAVSGLIFQAISFTVGGAF